jgi:hypothetical protein
MKVKISPHFYPAECKYINLRQIVKPACKNYQSSSAPLCQIQQDADKDDFYDLSLF